MFFYHIYIKSIKSSPVNFCVEQKSVIDNCILISHIKWIWLDKYLAYDGELIDARHCIRWSKRTTLEIHVDLLDDQEQKFQDNSVICRANETAADVLELNQNTYFDEYHW